MLFFVCLGLVFVVLDYWVISGGWVAGLSFYSLASVRYTCNTHVISCIMSHRCVGQDHFFCDTKLLTKSLQQNISIH